MKKIHFVLLFYTLLFALVYIFTLNVNYVEGDDATTVLYHLCGRNPSIQKPYAPYNSGFDYVLHFSQASEPLLRSLAIHLSFFFGWLVMCLSAIFLDIAFSEKPSNEKYVFLYLLPFIIPDFIFHSLIVNSVNISFTFALLSILFFMQFFKKGSWKYFVLSVLFLGISVPFRWSILTIFPVFYSLLLLWNEKSFFYRIKMTILHNVLALVLGIVCIDVSGYDSLEVFNTILSGKKYMEDSDRSVLTMFAMGVAFFTVSFVGLMIIGLFLKFYKQKKQQLLENATFLILPIIPFFILGLIPSFKFLISVLPILLIIAMNGYIFVAKHKILHGVFLTTLALSWFIGVHIDASGTTAGPGFEMKLDGKLSKNKMNENNIDERVKINKVSLAFGEGFYMPMLEGPRPLYGFYHVIFGGGWKRNIQEFTDERMKALNILTTKKGYTFMQERKTAYMQCDLFRIGYKTSKPFVYDAKQNLEYRDFYNDKDTIRMYVITDKVIKIDFAKEYIRTHDKVLLRSSYSSIILGIMSQDSSLTALGPYTVLKN
jgi:hypothetical protein